MILEPPTAGHPFLGLSKVQRQALGRALKTLPQRQFRGSWKMKDHLDTVTELLHKRRSPLGSLEIPHAVVRFLLEVIDCANRIAPKPTPRSLAPVISHIATNLDAPLTIAELADKAGLSESRFKSRFKEEYGVPPAEYVLRVRIEEAKRRLRSGHGSITRIAFDLGFSSSQYFATVFKRLTGQSPAGWRARERKPPTRPI